MTRHVFRLRSTDDLCYKKVDDCLCDAMVPQVLMLQNSIEQYTPWQRRSPA